MTAVDRVPSDDELEEFEAKIRSWTDIALRVYMNDPTPVAPEYKDEVLYEIRRRAHGGKRDVEDKELLSGMARRTR